MGDAQEASNRHEWLSPMIMRRIRARLPRGVGDAAHDSAWTLAFEACLILIITASFLMLGRQLGPAGYGEYVGLFAIITPVSAIGSAAALATLQACFQEGRPVDFVVGAFLKLVVLGGILATLIVAFVAPLILDDLTMLAIVTIALSELVMVPAVRVMAGSIRVAAGVPAEVRSQMVMLFGRFSVLVILFATDTLTVERLGVGWLLATSVVAVFLLVIHLPKFGIHVRRASTSFKDLKTVVQLGAPIYVSDFQTNGDKLVLNGAGLQAEAGLYGAAWRIANMTLTPLRAMNIAVFHRFLTPDDDERGAHVRRSKKFTFWSILVIVPIAAVVFVAAPLLVYIVGEEFSESVTMLRWLMLWVPIRAISLAPLSGLLGLNRLGTRLWILVGSASISMVLYIALIPDMGWEGAVIGTIVSEICLAVLAWGALIWAQRRRDLELADGLESPASEAALG
ncbi:MAG: lipopolysaccharide biosynthesis protein [Acidimicrobiales bacterium]